MVASSLRYHAIGLLVVTGLLGGCASLDAGPVFSDVRNESLRRTGQTVQWISNGEEDAAVGAKVHTMLEGELTVDQAVQVALLNNRRLQGTYERLGVAQAQLVQAGLLKNPIFDGSYRFVAGAGGNGVLELTVVQNFLDVLLIPLKQQLAKAELERTKLDVTASVMNVAFGTRVAFFRLQATQQAAGMWRMALDAADASYDVARRLHKAGNITDLALAGERAQYEQAKLDYAAAETAVLESREQLNTLMGLWGKDTGWRATPALPPVPGDELDLADMETRAIRQSLDLAVAWQDIQAAAKRTGIKVASTAFPALEAGAFGEREAGGQWSVGPQIVAPIPIFDQGQAASAAGKAEIRRLWNEYTALAIDIRSESRKARLRLLNARQQAIYYRDVMVPLRRQITGESLLQYNAMQIGVFQLLLAKQMEIQAQMRSVEALRDYWIARAEMELILNGRLPGNMPGPAATPAGSGASQSVQRQLAH